MVFIVPFILIAYAVLYALAESVLPIADSQEQRQLLLLQEPTIPSPSSRFQQSLDDWIQDEEEIALDRLLANIAPNGKNVADAAPGSVIASPSREHPDYYYQWVRDAAITISTLVELYAEDPYDDLSSKLLRIVQDYADLQAKIQHVDNISGRYDDLSGLGEPKFHANGSAFNGNWGRPQRDGPALRALALMAFVRAYNASHPSLWASNERDKFFKPLYNPVLPVDSTIKADLEYTSHNWRYPGFDLWEELPGLHFFTAMVQHRALTEGAALAAAFGDPGAAAWYTLQAHSIQATLLPSFWSPQKHHLIETLDAPSRSGLDCAILLGALHGTSKSPTRSPSPYPPHAPEVLLTLLAFIRDQRARFPINSDPDTGAETENPDILAGVALGRYPEDRYTGYATAPDGGNPWFLCTAAAAEILYRTASYLTTTNSLHISPLSAPFWSHLLNSTGSELEGTYEAGTPVFEAAVSALRGAGDAFVRTVGRYTGRRGGMGEQFGRVTGEGRGARDLTWSYGAFVMVGRARRGR
ncbi:glycoside hydrolase family 15 protein [Patellaria atrata CBS 101060]|uniref:glucan 1,4-alpha-glucosidase n=1 Tax=Patellaria atrata CBS 101060 TaxID=1346257 RepID=A0A9P4S9U9_9PEZI|nr:glycoside hydrolase family 15 protein [Patellaria atrata CBS 101060]